MSARFPCPCCGHTITDQDAAGYTIIRDDENHKATVERCVALARDWSSTASRVGQPECSSMADDIASSLRSLIKEDGE